jgi:hypothetical protein
MFTLVSIIMICILNVFTVCALSQNEAAVSVSWLSQTRNAGEMASARITFMSESSEPLTIFRIGLHFDWMPAENFYTLDLSDDPVVIPSYGSHTFDSMAFLIPPTVSAGSHSYFVGIDGFQGSSTTGFSWDSQTFMLQIGGSSESVYSELLPQVASKISEAANATYNSPEARSLVTQATNDYYEALELAEEGRLQEATSALQNASDNLEQANLEEQRFGEQDQTLLIIIVAVIIVISTVSIIALAVRKKRKQNNLALTADMNEDS